MDLIFFLLTLALVLSDALVILSSKALIWDFKLSLSFSKFLNFLASLESLFHLRLSCLLVRGTSNSGSQVDICGGRFGSQVAPLDGAPEGDICEAGAACPCGGGEGGLWALCSLFWRKAIKSAFVNRE